MEWLIIMVIVMVYCDLSSKLKKIINNQNANHKKDFSMLKDMIGKMIKIDTDEEYIFDLQNKGILKEYNDTWLVLETEDKKGKSIVYYRIKNITEISEV